MAPSIPNRRVAKPKSTCRQTQVDVAPNPNRRQLLTSPPHCRFGLFKRLAETHTTAVLFRTIQIPPNPQSKPGQANPNSAKANPNKNAWFYLVLFVRFGTYQWVTAIPNKKFSPRPSPCHEAAPRPARLRFWLPAQCRAYSDFDKE